MKVLICLVASQNVITDAINRQREKLIPQDLFKGKSGPDYPLHFKIVIFNPQSNRLSLDKYLLSCAKEMDAVVLLIERQHVQHTQCISQAIFGTIFETPNERLGTFKNFFGSYFSLLFRNFFVLKKMMGVAVVEQALMLPIRNFEAAELTEITRLVREDSRSPAFAGDMNIQLTELLKRRRTRKNSTFPTKYFIDDKGMHFVYGNEHHAQFDTGAPHTAACHLNGLFRFGKSIDKSRHYNVSLGDGDITHIAGELPDCHGAIKKIPTSPRRSHVNMFANDFC